MKEHEASVFSNEGHRPKNCPRCGLVNPGTAERCDCGYDFIRGTVEKSYFRAKPPRGLKTFITLIVLLNVLGAMISVVNDDWTGFAAIIIIVPLILWAYGRFLKRKNGARIVLAVLTAPLGLLLLFSREMRLYCLQKD